MKRIHYLFLGLGVSLCLAAVSPSDSLRIAAGTGVTVVTNGTLRTISSSGGGSGILTSNGLGTNTTFYSGGTTNRPLRVFGTNGTSETYVDKDGKLVSDSILVNPSSYPAGVMIGTTEYNGIGFISNSGYGYLFNQLTYIMAWHSEGIKIGQLAIGFAPSPVSFADTYIKRSAANTIRISSAFDGTGSANLVVNGNVSLTVGGAIAKAGGTLFAQTTTNPTVSTDGTEDNLYSITLAPNVFSEDLQTVIQQERANFVASATAARRLKKYFGGTLIFDSGALTLTSGGDFSITTRLTRHSSSFVVVTVTVATTSASMVPYVTATTVGSLTLTNTQILKTTGIASGTGAAAGDITNDRVYGQWFPAP